MSFTLSSHFCFSFLKVYVRTLCTGSPVEDRTASTLSVLLFDLLNSGGFVFSSRSLPGNAVSGCRICKKLFELER